MNTDTHKALFKALFSVTKPSDVRQILQTIGDSPELIPDEVFGEGFHWHFYGDRESNMSTINLGSKPGRSIVERVTNAVDAVLEKESFTRKQIADSPMDAAKRWFGRPPSGVDSGLFTWDDKYVKLHELDRLINVVLVPGDKDTAPTIDVMDRGIGIRPANFADTILSLQHGNKIKKGYLAGAWGQGGSATIAFSDFVLVVSRHIDSPNLIGFTIIKLMKLRSPYKEDAYVYLACADDAGKVTVPQFAYTDDIDFYPTVSSHKPKPLKNGTMVRHYGYKLSGLEKALFPSPGNLYHLFHNLMFDPLLPFRVIDLRKSGSYKDERVSGSRNRLMQYTKGMEEASEEPETSGSETSGNELRHFMPREMVSPYGDVDPAIGIEYWVIFNRRKSGDKVTLRSHSNEVFIERNHPIVGTLHGQNHGELSARILSELKLSMVSRHIVIHIDTTQLSSDIRKDLFTSTREAFKDGDILTELTRVLTNMLKEDDTLREIERELLTDLLKRDNTEVRQEVRKQITSLLRDTGFQVTEPGEVLVGGTNGPTRVAPPLVGHRRKRVAQEPLPTLPYPQVTRFEIVYPKGKLSVPQQDNRIVRIETDANFRFGREKKLAIRFEPPSLEVASEGLLKDGRAYWRVRPTANSEPGDTGQIIASLTKPDGSQLTATVEYEVLPPREEGTERVKGQVPAFDVKQIDPEEDPEGFGQVWPNVDLDNEDEVAKVAYRSMSTEAGIIVYYSTAFSPYKDQLESLKKVQPTLAPLFSQNYEVWIGYHAIVQSRQKVDLPNITELSEEQLDRIQEHERAVVAAIQVKQALKMAQLQVQSVKETVLD